MSAPVISTPCEAGVKITLSTIAATIGKSIPIINNISIILKRVSLVFFAVCFGCVDCVVASVAWLVCKAIVSSVSTYLPSFTGFFIK